MPVMLCLTTLVGKDLVLSRHCDAYVLKKSNIHWMPPSLDATAIGSQESSVDCRLMGDGDVQRQTN